MLKGYLSEAASLFMEAVLGAPVKAQAQTCWWTGGWCVDPCNSCGAGKRAFREWICCSTGHCFCGPTVYCDYC